MHLLLRDGKHCLRLNPGGILAAERNHRAPDQKGLGIAGGRRIEAGRPGSPGQADIEKPPADGSIRMQRFHPRRLADTYIK